MRRFAARAAGFAVVALTSACSYGPTFRRDRPSIESRPGPAPGVHAEPRLRLALGRCSIRDTTEERLFVFLSDALRTDAHVAAVVSAEAAPGTFDARLLFHVERHVRTTPANFAIAWPGGLIDAPFWYGFEWPYEVKARVEIEGKDGTVLASRSFVETFVCYYTPTSYAIPLSLSLPTATISGFWVGWEAATAEGPPNLATVDRIFAKDEGPFWARRIADRVVPTLVREVRRRRASF